MKATHMIRVGFKNGTGLEIFTDKESQEAALSHFRVYRSDPSWRKAGETGSLDWLIIKGWTSSDTLTISDFDMREVIDFSIIELPTQSNLAIPRPRGVSS